MLIAIIILSILLCVSLFANWNLLRKNEAQEDDIEFMNTWMNDISTRTNDVLRKARSIDRRGMFEKDDEVGSLYSELKKIIETLENLIVKVNE
tara:strand:+ start:62 stop:340 length:279 start_codon:yes stop_codon:yes gene_type:complete